ncbi:hypothetical protein [Streptomyces sp. NPDC089919]|uniref:hypothetical protein n=1 Tax=Streptomyces sp. NPDC089919 TaxID=3155188 RepID=UPI00342EF39B
MGGVPAQHTPWPERTPARPSWAQSGPDTSGGTPYERPAAAGRHRGAPTPSEGDDLYQRLAPDTAGEPGYPAPGTGPASETAYLPPVREDDGTGSGYPAPVPDAGAETAYLPPVREGDGTGSGYPAPAPDEGAETAYLPPVREDDGRTGSGYPAPVPDAGAETAYLPPVREGDAAGYPAGGPEGDSAAGGPAYSSPVTMGNTRIKDPQEARAQGRSPIIDPGPQSALLTAGLGVLLAGAAAVGQYALLLPLVALQALTAAGWFRLNGMWPARQGIALAFLGGLVADAAVLATDRGPAAVLGTLGVWVLLTLVLQLRSHADPDERVYGLMASVASAALAVICAGYLAADHAAVTAGALAVAVAAVVRSLPLPPAASVTAALLAATGAGVAAGGVTDLGAGAALVGLGAGVCALIGLRVAAYDYPSKFVHMTAGVALPLAAAAPAVHLLGRVVAG